MQVQMVPPPTQVIIPFRPLMLQIVGCLGFPPPKFKLLDEMNNSVQISVQEKNRSASHIYIGGRAPTVGESCEVAARQAVSDLMGKFNVIVKDVTWTEKTTFDKCTALFELKYTEFENLEKGIGKTTLYEGGAKPQVADCKTVILDYMSVLRAILQKLEIRSVHIETVEHDPSHFTSLFVLDPPTKGAVGKCIVGECCSNLAEAENSMAKKAVNYLVDARNLKIVDANYNNLSMRLAPVSCGLQKESFKTIKERVLGIKDEVEPSCFLGEGECVTPRDAASHIPTMNGPPLAPKKRRSSYASVAASVVPESRNHVPVFFSIPEPLESVFSRPRRGQ